MPSLLIQQVSNGNTIGSSVHESAPSPVNVVIIEVLSWLGQQKANSKAIRKQKQNVQYEQRAKSSVLTEIVEAGEMLWCRRTNYFVGRGMN
jgi:hypothetical protein